MKLDTGQGSSVLSCSAVEFCVFNDVARMGFHAGRSNATGRQVDETGAGLESNLDEARSTMYTVSHMIRSCSIGAPYFRQYNIIQLLIN